MGIAERLDRVTESNAILMAAWDVMSQGSEGFESLRGGLVEVSWSGYPVIFFNLAVTARPPASIEELEAAAGATFRWAEQRKVPWIFAVCHETMGELMPYAETMMQRLGFAPMMALTGMDANELSAVRRPTPKGPLLTEADSSIGDKVIRLNEAAYQTALGEPGSLRPEQPGWWCMPERMATVMVPAGKPASCAAVFSVGGLRYVALVATHPDEQRKGYAEAAMRNVLERSLAAGLKNRTYLHASPEGKPLYERMGYTVTANYTLYARNWFYAPEH